MQNDENKTETKVEEVLREIENTSRELPKILKEILNPNFEGGQIYSTDLFMMGVVSRTMSLANAICTMHEQRNFLTAAALLRMNLDTAVRVWGSSLAPDFEKFCERIIAGERIDKMMDRKGKKMTDRYLVESLANSKISPSALNVYQKTSGFVHLSGPHVFGMVQEMKENGAVTFFVGPTSPAATEESWEELLEAFLHFTTLIFGLVDRYREIRMMDTN